MIIFLSATKGCNGTKSKGFTLVEVLIAFVILFAAIVSFSAAFKAYTDARLKQQLYQDAYIAVVSLKNRLETTKLAEKSQGSGDINRFHFSYTAKPVETARNYIYGDEVYLGGNVGGFQITVYKVDLKLGRKNWKRNFSFYVTQYVSDEIKKEDS